MSFDSFEHLQESSILNQSRSLFVEEAYSPSLLQSNITTDRLLSDSATQEFGVLELIDAEPVEQQETPTPNQPEATAGANSPEPQLERPRVYTDAKGNPINPEDWVEPDTLERPRVYTDAKGNPINPEDWVEPDTLERPRVYTDAKGNPIVPEDGLPE